MKTAYTATEPMGKCGICGEAIEPKRKFVTPIEALGYTEFMHETCFEARVESDVLQAERENTEWMQNYLQSAMCYKQNVKIRSGCKTIYKAIYET